MVPVTYINTDAGTALAVMQVEGRQVTMRDWPGASGARYVSIDEQVGYRWHSKGDEAMLAHLAADHTAEEEVLLRDCRIAR
jgi:membrane-bound inhibitor of C-type lysozyme